MNTLTEIVEQHVESDAPPEALVAALMAREDAIRDALFLTSARLGLFPQIVAEELVAVGLGTPPTEAERAMIRQNYVALWEQIAAAQRGEGPMPQPPAPA